MQKILFAILSLISCAVTFGEDNLQEKTSEIVNEGKRLYTSEMASWYGTEIFLERSGSKRADIGGYLSYTRYDTTRCIYFSSAEHPKVIGTILFDSTLRANTAILDNAEREFSEDEFNLFTIRKLAVQEVTSDTFFKIYQNTELNFIPIISNGEKKVYILTAPKEDGYVIIGNDYLMTFDKENKVISKRQLHMNIIPIDYGKDEDIMTMHTHAAETGDFITATDVCTLMLYEKSAAWKQHFVISENYVSIWNCNTDTLATITKEVWENIYNDQKKGKKKKDK